MTHGAYAEEMAKKHGLLQSLDPRVKIIGLMSLLIAATLARNIFVIAAIFSIGMILAILSQVRISALVMRASIGTILFTGLIALPAIFITPGRVMYHLPILNWHITAQGLQSALYLTTRTEAALVLSLLLVLCTLWTDVLKALWILGVPAVFIMILGVTYRYIFLLLQTAYDMLESHESRRIGVLEPLEKRRLAAASVGVLLMKSFNLSREVSLAMQSRGFRGKAYTLDDFKMRRRDWVALFVFLLLTVAALWLGRA